MPSSVSSVTSRPHHVWQPDSSARKCTICESAFNLLRRRHHCRRCGSVICADCSMHRLRIPVTRIAVKQSNNVSSQSNDGDEMDVVRVCDTCYSKHQQLKSKRKARAASIESASVTERQSSRQSSRHSSPSSARSSIHITNEHNVPLTHQLLRPASSNALASLHINNQSRSPHAPAQASVLPSVPSLPRTPRQIDDTFSLSKRSEQRIRSQSNSDTLFTTHNTPSSALRRSLSSASKADEDLTQTISTSAIPPRTSSSSPTNHLEIVQSNNSAQSQSSQSSPSRRSPKRRVLDSSNDVAASDMMSPKSVHHRAEYVPPAWCDNVLAVTGITLPITTSSTSQQSNPSLQTESFMDSLQILSWIEPIIKAFNAFAVAFVDRPVACMMVLALILLILHRLRPFYSILLVIMQLITLHNAVWHHLSTNRVMEDQSVKQIIMSTIHLCIHGVLAPFQPSSSKSSSKALDTRSSDMAWLCFGLIACYFTYFIRWPLFWSACIARDLTRSIVKKKHKIT